MRAKRAFRELVLITISMLIINNKSHRTQAEECLKVLTACNQGSFVLLHKEGFAERLNVGSGSACTDCTHRDQRFIHMYLCTYVFYFAEVFITYKFHQN